MASPRGALTSLSWLLARYSVLLPSSSSTLSRHHLLSALPYSSTSLSKNLPRSAMDIRSTDTEEAKKSQQSETCYQGASDINPSRKLADGILPHILNLYGSCAMPQDFDIYAPNASFEDPLTSAHGIKQIKSAFYSIPKVFSESRIVEYSIEENILTHGKKEIIIDSKQYYKFMGKDIDLISLIRLYVENGKVIRHEDWWDKKPLWNRETSNVPLVGEIMEMARRGAMLVTHAMMRFGKDPTT